MTSPVCVARNVTDRQTGTHRVCWFAAQDTERKNYAPCTESRSIRSGSRKYYDAGRI